VDSCWRYLTDLQLVSEWFADASGSLASGGAFEFHFGDGDFFRGMVESAVAPISLRLCWKFMDVGLTSQIEYALLPLRDGKTLVSVIDRGEYSDAGAAEMAEGWDDFMARLERRVRTGQNSRYRCSETIGCAAIMLATPEQAKAYLRNPEVWCDFEETRITRSETESALVVMMTNPLWNGQTTAASLRFRQCEAGTCLSVTHEGFDRLSEPIRFNERKRYAGFWASFLAGLEARSETASRQRYAECQ
jgi:uncharacterized protein YndB with AHSA1/START domain